MADIIKAAFQIPAGTAVFIRPLDKSKPWQGYYLKTTVPMPWNAPLAEGLREMPLCNGGDGWKFYRSFDYKGYTIAVHVHAVSVHPEFTTPAEQAEMDAEDNTPEIQEVRARRAEAEARSLASLAKQASISLHPDDYRHIQFAKDLKAHTERFFKTEDEVWAAIETLNKKK